jgi:hypothetical protein
VCYAGIRLVVVGSILSTSMRISESTTRAECTTLMLEELWVGFVAALDSRCVFHSTS